MAGYWITFTNSLNSWAVDRPPLSLVDADPDATILMTPGIKPDGGEVQALLGASPAYGKFYVRHDISDEELIPVLKFLEYTLFGAGDKEVHAPLIFGEKDVDWKWNDDKTGLIKTNNLQSGKKEHGPLGSMDSMDSMDRIVVFQPGQALIHTKNNMPRILDS